MSIGLGCALSIEKFPIRHLSLDQLFNRDWFFVEGSIMCIKQANNLVQSVEHDSVDLTLALRAALN